MLCLRGAFLIRAPVAAPSKTCEAFFKRRRLQHRTSTKTRFDRWVAGLVFTSSCGPRNPCDLKFSTHPSQPVQSPCESMEGNHGACSMYHIRGFPRWAPIRGACSTSPDVPRPVLAVVRLHSMRRHLRTRRVPAPPSPQTPRSKKRKTCSAPRWGSQTSTPKRGQNEELARPTTSSPAPTGSAHHQHPPPAPPSAPTSAPTTSTHHQHPPQHPPPAPTANTHHSTHHSTHHQHPPPAPTSAPTPVFPASPDRRETSAAPSYPT